MSETYFGNVCKGAIALGSGCLRCGKCAVQLAERVRVLEAQACKTVAATSFYAVAYDDSTTIPGDERSRTQPGHGYPEHTVTTKVFKAFDNMPDFEEWIRMAQGPYATKRFAAYRCTPLKISTKIEVSVE